jgi:hypothetical protein
MAQTDGSPSDGDLIIRVIRDASQKLKRSPYGSDALSIQIAQVRLPLAAILTFRLTDCPTGWYRS